MQLSDVRRALRDQDETRELAGMVESLQSENMDLRLNLREVRRRAASVASVNGSGDWRGRQHHQTIQCKAAACARSAARTSGERSNQTEPIVHLDATAGNHRCAGCSQTDWQWQCFTGSSYREPTAEN